MDTLPAHSSSLVGKEDQQQQQKNNNVSTSSPESSSSTTTATTLVESTGISSSSSKACSSLENTLERENSRKDFSKTTCDRNEKERRMSSSSSSSSSFSILKAEKQETLKDESITKCEESNNSEQITTSSSSSTSASSNTHSDRNVSDKTMLQSLDRGNNANEGEEKTEINKSENTSIISREKCETVASRRNDLNKKSESKNGNEKVDDERINKKQQENSISDSRNSSCDGADESAESSSSISNKAANIGKSDFCKSRENNKNSSENSSNTSGKTREDKEIFYKISTTEVEREGTTVSSSSSSLLPSSKLSSSSSISTSSMLSSSTSSSLEQKEVPESKTENESKTHALLEDVKLLETREINNSIKNYSSLIETTNSSKKEIECPENSSETNRENSSSCNKFNRNCNLSENFNENDKEKNNNNNSNSNSNNEIIKESKTPTVVTANEQTASGSKLPEKEVTRSSNTLLKDTKLNCNNSINNISISSNSSTSNNNNNNNNNNNTNNLFNCESENESNFNINKNEDVSKKNGTMTHEVNKQFTSSGSGSSCGNENKEFLKIKSNCSIEAFSSSGGVSSSKLKEQNLDNKQQQQSASQEEKERREQKPSLPKSEIFINNFNMNNNNSHSKSLSSSSLLSSSSTTSSSLSISPPLLPPSLPSRSSLPIITTSTSFASLLRPSLAAAAEEEEIYRNFGKQKNSSSSTLFSSTRDQNDKKFSTVERDTGQGNSKSLISGKTTKLDSDFSKGDKSEQFKFNTSNNNNNFTEQKPPLQQPPPPPSNNEFMNSSSKKINENISKKSSKLSFDATKETNNEINSSTTSPIRNTMPSSDDSQRERNKHHIPSSSDISMEQATTNKVAASTLETSSSSNAVTATSSTKEASSLTPTTVLAAKTSSTLDVEQESSSVNKSSKVAVALSDISESSSHSSRTDVKNTPLSDSVQNTIADSRRKESSSIIKSNKIDASNENENEVVSSSNQENNQLLPALNESHSIVSSNVNDEDIPPSNPNFSASEDNNNQSGNINSSNLQDRGHNKMMNYSSFTEKKFKMYQLMKSPNSSAGLRDGNSQPKQTVPHSTSQQSPVVTTVSSNSSPTSVVSTSSNEKYPLNNREYVASKIRHYYDRKFSLMSRKESEEEKTSLSGGSNEANTSNSSNERREYDYSKPICLSSSSTAPTTSYSSSNASNERLPQECLSSNINSTKSSSNISGSDSTSRDRPVDRAPARCNTSEDVRQHSVHNELRTISKVESSQQMNSSNRYQNFQPWQTSRNDLYQKQQCCIGVPDTSCNSSNQYMEKSGIMNLSSSSSSTTRVLNSSSDKEKPSKSSTSLVSTTADVQQRSPHDNNANDLKHRSKMLKSENDNIYQSHPNRDYNRSERHNYNPVPLNMLHGAPNSSIVAGSIPNSQHYNNSLYTSNPDFSRHLVPKSKTTSTTSISPASSSSQGSNLSQLHVRPPDFTKISSSSVSHPDVPKSAGSRSVSPTRHYPLYTGAGGNKSQEYEKLKGIEAAQITQRDFAEMSKKYNYISDLQLKNPTSGGTDKSEFSNYPKSQQSYNNLYMKAPDFNPEVFQTQKSMVNNYNSRIHSPLIANKDRDNFVQTPHPHQVSSHLMHPSGIQTDTRRGEIPISSETARKSSSSVPYSKQFPQLSHDVELSVVPPKPDNVAPKNLKCPSDRSQTAESFLFYDHSNRLQSHDKSSIIPKSSTLANTRVESENRKLKNSSDPPKINQAYYSQYPHNKAVPVEMHIPSPNAGPSGPSKNYAGNPDMGNEKIYYSNEMYNMPHPNIRHEQKSPHQIAPYTSVAQSRTSPYSHPQVTSSVIQSSKSAEYYPAEHVSPHHILKTQGAQMVPGLNPQSSQQNANQSKQQRLESVSPVRYHPVPSPNQLTNNPNKFSSPSPTRMMNEKSRYVNQQLLPSQQQQHPLSASSPSSGYHQTCPPVVSSQNCMPYKTTPSPNAMNPPYGWPGQGGNNNRVSQSPTVSPHGSHHRITQSPVGSGNNVIHTISPQSPSFLQPSPKASPSPTQLSRPSPQPPAGSFPIPSYKSPYPPSPSNVNYHTHANDTRLSQLPSHLGGGYPQKNEKPEASMMVPHGTRDSNNFIMELSEMGRQHSKRNENSPGIHTSPSPSASYSVANKMNTKTSTYPEHSQPPTGRKLSSDSTKSYPKYPSTSELYPRPEYPTIFAKSVSELNLSKNQKPNYREMINQVTALRYSTSEEDLNAEIIKRTLKKDISTRRSENDLSKSIFDPLVPRSNQKTYYPPYSENLMAAIPMKRNEMHNEDMKPQNFGGPYPPKTFAHDPYAAKHASNHSNVYHSNAIPKQYYPEVPPDSMKMPQMAEGQAKTNLPLCNELSRNDISVTVSKVIKSGPTVDKEIGPSGHSIPKSRSNQQPHYQESPPLHHQRTADYPGVVISKVESNHYNDMVVKDHQHMNMPRASSQTQPQLSIGTSVITGQPASVGAAPVSAGSSDKNESKMKSSTSIFSPTMKRESPLDLSVKTVKTKADSTGCDDNSNGHCIRTSSGGSASNGGTSSALKVDFSPNFSKHTIRESSTSSSRGPKTSPSATGITRPSSEVSRSIETNPKHYVQQPESSATSRAPNQPPTHLPYTAAGSTSYQASKLPNRDSPYLVHQPQIPYQNHVLSSSATPPISGDKIPTSIHHRKEVSLPSNSSCTQETYPVPPVAAKDQRIHPSQPHNTYQHGHLPEQQIRQADHSDSKSSTYYQNSKARYKDFEKHHEERPSTTYDSQKPVDNSYGHPSQFNVPTSSQSSSARQPSYMNPYLVQPPQTSGKKDSESLKQNVILNPPISHTVYDKKSDDYLMNTPQQRQKKLFPDKLSNTHGADVLKKTTTSIVSSTQVNDSRPNNVLQYEHCDSKLENLPSNISENYSATERGYRKYENVTESSTNLNKPHHLLHSSYERLVEDGNYQKSPIISKNASLPNHYNNASNHDHINPNPIKEQVHQQSDPDYNMKNHGVVEYPNRKRPLDNSHLPYNSGKDLQPAEKQVRVDELYRAHLEEKYRQHQQQFVGHSSNIVKQPEKRDVSVIQMKTETVGYETKENLSLSSKSSAPDDVKKFHYPNRDGANQHCPPALHFQQKDGPSGGNIDHRQIPPPPPSETVMSYQRPPEQFQTWHSAMHNEKYLGISHPYETKAMKKETICAPQSSYYRPSEIVPNPLKYGLDSERCRAVITEDKSQNSRSASSVSSVDPHMFPAIEMKKEIIPSALPHLNTDSQQFQPSYPSPVSQVISMNRGADQNVISKLRNSIEMREYEKQRISTLRKNASVEGCDEEGNKPDIASLIAARIRTKGELKGFTPSPSTPQNLESKAIKKESPKDNTTTPGRNPEFPQESEGNSAFDLGDWGSTCNDFVEQLLTGGNKKRSKRKRQHPSGKGTSAEATTTEHDSSHEKGGEDLPGTAYACDIDKSIVEDLKMKKRTFAKDSAGNPCEKLMKTKTGEKIVYSKEKTSGHHDTSSSDEDKPLLLLRQQSHSGSNGSHHHHQQQRSGKGGGSQNSMKSQDVTTDDNSVSTTTTATTMNTRSKSPTSNRSAVVEKLSEKIVRNMREKQRLEQEKRINARLSRTSSSDSEDDGKQRNVQRLKKFTRKPRSRASGTERSAREISDNDTDSSGAEERSMGRILYRGRVESRKRKLVEKLDQDFSDSDESALSSLRKVSRKKTDTKNKRDTGEVTGCGGSSQKSPSHISETENSIFPKNEMITKARVKCMKLSSSSGESSAEENAMSAEEGKSKKMNRKNENRDEEEEEVPEQEGKRPLKKPKNGAGLKKGKDPGGDESDEDEMTRKGGGNNKSRSRRNTRQSQDGLHNVETMTRSKRKKELEQQMANSKVLRNEKVIQNTVFNRKGNVKNQSSITSSQHQTNVDKSTPTKKSSDEKGRHQSNSKGKSSEKNCTESNSKRKHPGNESDKEKGGRKKVGRPSLKNNISSEDEDSDSLPEESMSDRLRSKRFRTDSRQQNVSGNEGGSSTKFPKKSKSKDTPKENESEKKSLPGKISGSGRKSNSSTTGPKNRHTAAEQHHQQQQQNNTDTFPPGWELEVYQYKRSLKVPASLISIKGPVHHRVSTSLPDLDPHSSDTSETFQANLENNSRRSQMNSKIMKNSLKIPLVDDSLFHRQEKKDEDRKKLRINKEQQIEVNTEENRQPMSVPKSIIDVLHSRVLKTKKMKLKNARVFSFNEPRYLPRATNEAELLPTPRVADGKPDPFSSEQNNSQNNLFHTEVLKSRTRTEYRIMKNKELIREVFGGEDRPASAPPEIRENELNNTEIKVEQISFDEKYREYLQQMNIDYGEKIRKNRKPRNSISNATNLESFNNKRNDNKINSNSCKIVSNSLDALDVDAMISTSVIRIKTEKPDPDDEDDIQNESNNNNLSSLSIPLNHVDEETQDNEIKQCLQQMNVPIKEEIQDGNERDTPSIASERDGVVVTPLIFRRKRGNKYRSGRRKFSSGFDYIRKKKKPQTNLNSSLDGILKRKRISPVEIFNTRNEEDVSKEIQKWVLNKSVGQSALHKAARLGYLDVIAYCLERLGMNPDQKDNAGYTPLHEACAKGRIDIARVLLQYGANHSETAHSGIRPLHEASENGYIEVVRLLLSYGADPLVATYSGQTPIELAESSEMEQFLRNHLYDVQNTGPHKQPWKFPGPWKIFDPDECGYDILEDAPEFDEEELENENIKKHPLEGCDTTSNCTMNPEEKLRKVPPANEIYATRISNSFRKSDENKMITRRRSTLDQNSKKENITTIKSSGNVTIADGDITNSADGEMGDDFFDFEESDMPLPPLYLLKDEGPEKWVMLSDLCNLLKVKSKDTLLKQLCPSTPPSTLNRELLKELKMSEFLEKATCLQLLCSGEKLNIRSSKVVLIKYNDSVKNLLGVKTILMKF